MDCLKKGENGAKIRDVTPQECTHSKHDCLQSKSQVGQYFTYPDADFLFDLDPMVNKICLCNNDDFKKIPEVQ